MKRQRRLASDPDYSDLLQSILSADPYLFELPFFEEDANHGRA